jgi:hypothetical protein
VRLVVFTLLSPSWKSPLRREGQYTNDRPAQDEQRRIYLVMQQQKQDDHRNRRRPEPNDGPLAVVKQTASNRPMETGASPF